MTEARQQHDQRLMACFERGVGGDAACYREFLVMVESMLRGYFRKRLNERAADVDDLVQEAVLAVHRRTHTFDGKVPVTVWIHAIARHKFIDLLRADATRAALFEPAGEASAEAEGAGSDGKADTDGFAAWQAQWDVRRLLATLPLKQRLAIEAVKIEGLSTEDAARRTGLSESAVKVYVHRGLRSLIARVVAEKAQSGPSTA
jgi:RNA polymerase sigma-70 factor, ECF subfamily